MANIMKKGATATWGMRLIVALLYGLATFGIRLSHTCQFADKYIHHRHFECLSHQLGNDSYVEVHHTAVFNQNRLSDKTDSHDLRCPVCLYSLTSKAFKLCSNTSSYSTQTAVRTHILPQLIFIKQLEWFCSAPLRAPPHIAS